MGKQTGIITFKGKVGNVVGARDSKGDLTIKAYQPEVRQSNTEGQIIARVKFLTMTALAKGLREGLFGLSNYAAQQKLTLTNAFQRLNKLMVECYPPDLTATPPRKDYEGHVDYIQLLISKGGVYNTIVKRAPAVEWENHSLSVEVDWSQSDAKEAGSETRLVYLVVFNENQNTTKVSTPVNYRDGGAMIEDVRGWEPGDVLHAWLVVQDFSDTVTMGRYLSYWNNGTPTAEAKASFDYLKKGADYSNSILCGTVTVPEDE